MRPWLSGLTSLALLAIVVPAVRVLLRRVKRMRERGPNTVRPG